ncbi:MAG: ATP-dependent protease LonB [Candidatus Nanoarchaeia archaeon]|jgi:Lon-like ATP-dependent protease
MATNKELNFKTTEEIKVPDKLVDQVIGQDKAINIIKKAASQKRNVLLIGQPGTGKSLLGQALAELLPKSELTDILCYPNLKDENNPIIKEVPAGKGEAIITSLKTKSLTEMSGNNWTLFIILFAVIAIIQFGVDWIVGSETSEILMAADRISGTLFMLAVMSILALVFATSRLKVGQMKTLSPKLLIDNKNCKKAPFIDASGAHEGALLGDVRHDPLQSGGLGTPAHERVEVGAVHKANNGVLFIDEIATIRPESQIDLLTAMQEKKLSITGRSERSSGAMTKTQPAPCDFVLVAAGNIETLQKLHPALRSRIQGYGYEVYMNDEMDDSADNRERIARFIAQEIAKDKGKTPHFTREAVLDIINQARLISGRKGQLTMKLRMLGGLVRVAGDVAREREHNLVSHQDVLEAVKIGGTLEQQLSERYTKMRKDYEVILSKGAEIGRVNGLAVLDGGGSIGSGLVMPIEAAVAPGLSKGKAEIIATGKLGEIAREAVQNVTAIIKKYKGKSISDSDIHIQFLQTFEGVEGDSASISVATAVLSALEGIPVRQDVAMTGSLSIRGEVLPVGGVSTKIRAANEAGIKSVIVPKMNEKDIILDGAKVNIIPVDNFADVIEHAFKWNKTNRVVLNKIKKVIK